MKDFVLVLAELIRLMSPSGRPEIKNSSDKKNFGASGCQRGRPGKCMQASADSASSLQMECCPTLLQTPKATTATAYAPFLLRCLSTYSAIKIQHL